MLRKLKRTKPLRFVDGRVSIGGVNFYSQEMAMDLLGITRPTYYKWVAEGKIKRTLKHADFEGGKPRWLVEEQEIKRVKEIIQGGWVRGKSKLAKPKKKEAKGGRKAK